MKNKHNLSLFITCSFLVFGALSGISHKTTHELRIDEFDPVEGAYFAGKIEDPTGLIKAQKEVVPSDNEYNSQKTRSLGSNLIGNIESVWDNYTGKGTTVAIIDDGFDYNHPDFLRKDGTNAILSTSRYYYASGSSAYYQQYSTDSTCIAEDWESDGKGGYEWATHGTNTASTAAAGINNGGGVGIAPEADILALKIDFSFAAIDAAIRYAVAQKVDVINMSLGAYAENFTDGWGERQEGSSSVASYLNSACKQAYDAGIIVVAAAGNESTWHKSYPACNTKVIGVGALGDWDNKGNATKLAEFTNYVSSSQTGEINVDILAPGYVYTATQGGSKSSISHTYSDTQGTSFSSPIIAGAACLWKQKYPNGTPDQFLSQLQSSADDIGQYKNKMINVSEWDSDLTDVGPSNITNGRLNVAKLMAVDDPFVTTVESSLNISVSENKQIHLNTYSGTISYKSSNTSVATVSTSGLVTGVGAGDTTITVTASKNGKTATATVDVHVADIIAANSISFSPKSISLGVGDTYNSINTITTNPTNASKIFLFESEDESVATVDEETGLVTAVGTGTTNINVIAVYGSREDTLSVTVTQSSTKHTGTVTFGKNRNIDVNDTSVSGSDSLNNIWTVTTTDTTSFTPNDSYAQIGSNNNPASSIEFTLSMSSNVTFSDVSASFGGFSKTVGIITIKAGATTIGSGSLSKESDVEIKSSSSAIANSLVVTVSNITAGVKVYSISYSYTGGGDTPDTPTVTSVSVSPSSLSLDIYSKPNGTLSATVVGTHSPSQEVTWSSSNNSVATVSSSGVVTAVGTGNATITATSKVDTTKKGTCSVSVTNSTPVTLSSISITGYKTSLKVNTTFEFGGTVTAYFSNGSNSDVTSSATFTGYNMSQVGTQTVTVSYTYNGLTKSKEYTLSVTSGGTITCGYTIGWGQASSSDGDFTNFDSTSGSVSDILSFSTQQNNATNPAYYTGSLLRLYYNSGGSGGSITITPASGMTFTGFTMVTATTPTVKYSVNEGTKQTVSQSNKVYSVSNLNITSSLLIQNANTSNVKLDIVKITLTYEKQDTSDKIVSSLSATYSGSDVYVGNELDTSKVSVTASFTDSTKYKDEVLDSADYQLSGFNSSTIGNKSVTVTYIGELETASSPLTTTFSVKVVEDAVTNVSITCSKTYHPGDVISKSDLVVKLTHASGKTSTTTSFTLVNDGYQFTYQDAPSGGSSANKKFTVNYASNNYDFNVSVSRTAYQTISAQTKTLSSSEFNNSDLSKSSSTASKTSVTIGGVGFTVTTNAYVFSSSGTYYLSFGKTAGSINNTSAFNTDLTAVTVTCKSGARTDGALKISKDGTTYVDYDLLKLQQGGYRYFKYEYTSTSSKSGAAAYSNIEKIEYKLSASDNAVNVSNYIMYEDNTNQCVSKLDIAINRLNTMSAAEKNIFWNSQDYVISTARERILAWARHEGKDLTFVNSTYQLSGINNGFYSISESSTLINIVTILSIVSFISLSFILIKKKTKR